MPVEKPGPKFAFALRQFGRFAMVAPALMNPLVTRLPPEHSCNRVLDVGLD